METAPKTETYREPKYTEIIVEPKGGFMGINSLRDLEEMMEQIKRHVDNWGSIYLSGGWICHVCGQDHKARASADECCSDKKLTPAPEA